MHFVLRHKELVHWLGMGFRDQRGSWEDIRVALDCLRSLGFGICHNSVSLDFVESRELRCVVRWRNMIYILPYPWLADGVAK